MQHRPQTGFSSRLFKPSGLHYMRQAVVSVNLLLTGSGLPWRRAGGQIVGGDENGHKMKVNNIYTVLSLSTPFSFVGGKENKSYSGTLGPGCCSY